MLQTTYLKIITGKARYGGRSSLKTWVFGVIRRTAQEISRKAAVERRRMIHLVPDEIEDADLEAPDEELERTRTANLLRSAMEALSDRQREVLHLVFYQGLTIAEAAEVMGVSLGSARTHYQRGKERLRTLLDDGENVA